MHWDEAISCCTVRLCMLISGHVCMPSLANTRKVLYAYYTRTVSSEVVNWIIRRARSWGQSLAIFTFLRLVVHGYKHVAQIETLPCAEHQMIRHAQCSPELVHASDWINAAIRHIIERIHYYMQTVPLLHAHKSQIHMRDHKCTSYLNQKPFCVRVCVCMCTSACGSVHV